MSARGGQWWERPDLSADRAPVDARQPHPPTPVGWASWGIFDARAFTVGASVTVHALARVWPNRVSAPCGASARVTDTDGPRATWAAGAVDCPTCTRRQAA